MKISPGWIKQNVFKKQKCLAKNLINVFVSEVLIKNVIFSWLLMRSVTHVFIKQIFRAVELAPQSSLLGTLKSLFCKNENKSCMDKAKCF
jgi:hypothetical protein